MCFEPLEDRRLLSVVPTLPAVGQAQPALEIHLLSEFDDAGSSSPFGQTANQIRGAYGLGTYSAGVLSNGISFGGINGDGSGQTIAIVDAYDDPDAASDLNAFSAYYGLPTFGGSGGPTFQKLNQSGQSTSLPDTDPSGPFNGSTSDWEMEESLDIEWAHAMAPMANIILFEASSASTSYLDAAVQTAENTPGVVAISMSWSGAESGNETSSDATYFTTPAGHVGGAASVGGTGIAGGITFLAATGDSGAYASGGTKISPQYPAASPNVVAVGGTSLTTSGDSYVSESSWGNNTSSGTAGGGGGGVSKYESQPSFQSGVTNAFSASKRSYPDVSAEANPNDGVPIYDSYDFGATTPWVPGYMGGTSLATPLWAGIIAVADQGRALSGLGSLNGKTQTLPLLYQIDSTAPSSFNDITMGNSIGPTSGTPSYTPGTGYDLATGIGSPIANLLVPRLVGIPTVTTAAAASSSPVTGMTTALSVVASASGDASDLTYTWAATSLPTGAAAPTFSVNGTNAANDATVTFSHAGTYTLAVTIADSLAGGTTTSSVSVTVNQTLTSIAVGPASISLDATATQQFTATGYDQFGTALATQPSFTWATTVGAISTTGLLTASSTSASGMVTATSGSTNGSSVVTVAEHAPTVAVQASASSNPVTGTSTNLSVQGADIDPDAGDLTYTWAATTVPSGTTAPTFSANNGANAASTTTATFSAAGTYVFTVTITDPGGLSVTSSVNVTVDQTLTSIAVTMTSPALISNATQQFTAIGSDQFGAAMSPTDVTWSASAGLIDGSGMFTAPFASGSVTVTASSGSVSGTAVVTVDEAVATPGSVIGTTTVLSVSGAENDPEGGNVVYTWAAAGTPPAAVNFSDNGTNTASETTATFSAAGTYVFTLTIAGPDGQTATSSVNVTVNQTPTNVIVTGQPLAATAFDQFGNPLASQPAFDAGSDSISTSLPAAGNQLTISGGISGASALTVDTQGTVILTGTNSYTGGTTVSAGTLIATSASSIAPNTGLVIGAGGIFIFDPSINASPAEVGAATTATVASSAGATAMSIPEANAPTAATSAGTFATTPAATSSATSSTSPLTPPVALSSLILPQGVNNNPPGGKVRLPTVPSVVPEPRSAGHRALAAALLSSSSSVPITSSRAPSADRVAVPSIAQRIVGDLNWLGQAASSSDSSDQDHKHNLAIQALDAVFAQYGQ